MRLEARPTQSSTSGCAATHCRRDLSQGYWFGMWPPCFPLSVSTTFRSERAPSPIISALVAVPQVEFPPQPIGVLSHAKSLPLPCAPLGPSFHPPSGRHPRLCVVLSADPEAGMAVLGRGKAPPASRVHDKANSCGISAPFPLEVIGETATGEMQVETGVGRERSIAGGTPSPAHARSPGSPASRSAPLGLDHSDA